MSTPARDHDQWADSLGAWLLGALPEDEAAGFKRHLDECAVCREDAAIAAGRRRRAARLGRAARAAARAEGRGSWPSSRARPSCCRPPARSPTARTGAAPTAARGSAGSRLAPGARAGPRRARARLRRRPGCSQSGGPETITAQVSRRRPRDARGARTATGRLVASHLPAPPSGRVYQVWLDKGGKAPEPTNALFSTSSDGSASVDVPLARRRQARDGHRRADRRLATRRPESSC